MQIRNHCSLRPNQSEFERVDALNERVEFFKQDSETEEPVARPARDTQCFCRGLSRMAICCANAGCERLRGGQPLPGGGRSEVCCVHCPQVHTRACNKRERDRAAGAPPAAPDMSASPPGDPRPSAAGNEDAVTSLLIWRQLSEQLRQLTLRCEALEEVCQALSERIDACEIAAASSPTDEAAEPSPEPSMAPPPRPVRALQVGDWVTEQNFVPGYLVTPRGVGGPGPGLYVVDWAQMSTAELRVWWNMEQPPERVENYRRAMELWRATGCQHPMARIQ